MRICCRKVTNIRGITPPQTNWVGDNTQEAINFNPNNRYDFDYSAAYDPEIIPKTIGALPKDEVQLLMITVVIVSSKANWAYCNCQRQRRI
jgi:hypothetical protein